MLADRLDYVIGVDTHRDEHVLAVVAAPTGALIARRSVRTDRAGYRAALAFAGRFAAGSRVWAVEGSGCYGAGLVRMLAAHAETVVEAGRPLHGERRLRGKDDALDALRTARALLSSETVALPRSGERREALRLLVITRRSAVDVRRHALVQLRAVIVTAPDALRDELRRLPLQRLLDRCSRLRKRVAAPVDEAAVRLTLRTLARRVQAATVEAEKLEREIANHVRALAPALLDEPGVGPIVAAQLIITWSHHGRLHSEAAFAGLAGVAPLPASSGQTVRHRLSRGGDRQLNRALHTIVLHRLRGAIIRVAFHRWTRPGRGSNATVARAALVVLRFTQITLTARVTVNAMAPASGAGRNSLSRDREVTCPGSSGASRPRQSRGLWPESCRGALVLCRC